MYFTIKRSILVLTLFVTLVGWLSVLSTAQQNAIRIGVAVMQNQAGRSVSGTLERDRLVQALNHMKPDKKTHMQVEAVALDAMSGNEADDEAASKKCAYVVFTTLTELRSFDDPYQHQPNTIETNPNSQWSPGQRLDPEYRVTVVYKLYRTGGPEVAGSPYSTQVAMNEIDAVSQVMDRIALRVADEVKKGTPVPMKE